MRKIKLVEQMEHSECGLACVAMLMNYLGANIQLNQLRDEYGVPVGGFNLLQMSQILNDYEVKTKGIKINNIMQMNKKTFPCIAFWKGTHFVIIEKVSRKIKIIDPTYGKRNLSLQDFMSDFSGLALILLDPDARLEPQKKENNSLFRDILIQNRKTLLGLIAATLILQFITLTIPYMIQDITDRIGLIEGNSRNIHILSLLIIVIGYYGFNILRAILITKLQINMDDMLLTRLISHLLKVPIKFFVNRNKGEIIYRINSNSYIRQIVSEKMITVFIDVIFFILYLYAMIQIHFKLTMTILLFSVLICVLSVIYTKKLNGVQQNQIIYSVKAQNLVTEIVENIATVKSFGIEESIQAKWKEAFNKQMQFEEVKAKYTAFLGNLPSTIQVIFPAIIYIIGSSYVSNNLLTIGQLIAFNTLAGFFLTPILSLASSYSDIIIVKIYINKLLDIINSEAEAQEEAILTLSEGDISLKNLYFQYDRFSPFVLKNINIDIPGGSKVAIVGSSGSGKSTLLKILASLYAPTAGDFSIDGVNVMKINRRTLRKQLGVVLQESQLFNETIKNNVLFYREYNEEHFEDILSSLKINEMLSEFPIGVSTIVSEGGTNFSGGQRQRISSARALYQKPKILLLDEPTSSLDRKSLRDFMDILFESEATCIMVSHRYHDIENFDHIYVMKDGVIVADGRHHELLEKSRDYQELYLSKEEVSTATS